MVTDQGDKQAVIGCQATDKKLKVNVKLLDHSMSISPPLSLFSKLYPSSCHPPFWQRASLSPQEDFSFIFWHLLLSFSLSSLPSLSDSNQTSNYSSALRPGQRSSVCVCV